MPVGPAKIQTPRGPFGPAKTQARRPVSGGFGVGVWSPPNPAIGTAAYVRKTGSDSNGGTSPSDAWLTVQKAVSTAAPGATVYVGAGVYRETLNVTITPTQSLPVAIVGDVDGDFTGDSGMVQVTAYTTSDSAVPSSTTLLNLNGKSNLTFKNIMFVQGNAVLVTATTATSRYISFVACSFHGYFVVANSLVGMTTVFGTSFSWMFDGCYLFGPSITNSGLVVINAPTSATGGSDYSMDITFRNCVSNVVAGESITAAAFIRINDGTSSTFKPGGLVISNCFLSGGIVVAQAAASNMSVNLPSRVTGCVIIASAQALAQNPLGVLVEDYNLICAPTPRSLVAVGPHSISNGSAALLFHLGQERIWGGNQRPFGEPMASSPLSGFGNDGVQAPYDIRGGPRPTGIVAPAVGAYERGNNFVKETGTVHTGSNAISVIGDGFYDFDINVDAGSTTLSIYCQVDSNYRGPPPRLQILANGLIGVGDMYDAGSASGVGAFEQLSVTIVPTGSGIVTVRVISSDVSKIAKTVFDTFAAG